jgi:hypothetical protein
MIQINKTVNSCMKSRVLVNGCSASAGFLMGTSGTEKYHDPYHPDLWHIQICNRVFGKDNYTFENLAQVGASNSVIFLNTAQALLKNKYDVAVVQWSTLDRINFHVGFEEYPTMVKMHHSPDVNLVGKVTVPGKWLNKLGDDLRSVQNNHYLIMDLLRYINILVGISELVQTKIFFVETPRLWSPDFLTQRTNFEPRDLSEFEQEILDVAKRDDDQIYRMYNLMHDSYSQIGGVHEDKWLNLYSALIDYHWIDGITDNDKKHPGVATQKLWAEVLSPILTEKLCLQN